MKFKKIINRIIFTTALMLAYSCGNSYEQSQPDINKIIDKMTMEEKLDFIGGYDDFNIRAYEHLGIPEIRFADGPVGIRNYGKSTAYPATIALAASWDKKLAHNYGKALAEEAKTKNVQVVLGPGMNIYRFPVNGRNFEYLGEDPYLAGQMAMEYTRGMQENGVIATAKHYVANNQEYNRHHCSSDMDERTLHEIYLPAFKTVVQEGKVGAVMTSYNLINGVHASEHDYLINDVLKADWGFEGIVMSDWNSTYDGLACAKNGLDLEMPSGKLMNREILTQAINDGELSESVINEKIYRILSTYKRFGFFEEKKQSENHKLDSTFVRNTALDVARGGIVLLKNEEDILPLNKASNERIVVIGPNGNIAITGGGGSSEVNPLIPVTLLDALEQNAQIQAEINYEKGVSTGVDLPDNIFHSSDFYVYRDNEKLNKIHAEFFSNKEIQGDIIYSAYYDSLNLDKAKMKEAINQGKDYSARFSCYFNPKETANYCFAVSGDDGYRLLIDGKTVIDNWSDHGEETKRFDNKMLAEKEYKIEVQYYQSGGGATIKLGAKKMSDSDAPKDYLALAVGAAGEADKVILAVGHNKKTECEGFDRTYELPYKQAELIRKVSDVNPNTIVVLNAGGNVEMQSWIGNVKALLMAWYPGQEGALAITEILYGETNPSGKIPASFEKKLEDSPVYHSYWDNDGDQKVFYNEGIFVGYRYFDQSEIKPRYPFGFGLSYTDFEYSDVSVSKKKINPSEKIKLTVKVSNTGEFDGAEIVQVYVSDTESSLSRPIKELKAFEKVFLKKGETQELEFELEKDAFSFYNPSKHEWETEPGEFEILIGGSSVDIRQKLKIELL